MRNVHVAVSYLLGMKTLLRHCAVYAKIQVNRTTPKRNYLFSVQQAANEYFIVNLRNDATVIARLVDK